MVKKQLIYVINLVEEVLKACLKFYAKNYFTQDQFYDISKDPFEQDNGYKNTFNEDLVEELKLELKKYIDDLPGTFPLSISKPIVKD
ncbi:MAG: hypothetical protein CM15mP32_2470 [Flavobacteriaceae bacterium]|nr:MAG: hypothetical protein CM15mP32_2470 [Flavobacteriaceae bacterium]